MNLRPWRRESGYFALIGRFGPVNARGAVVHKILSCIIATSVFLLLAEAAAAQAAKKKISKSPSPALTGIASVYKYNKARRSASGEVINFKTHIAAHRTFRFGTQVRVTNRRNGKSVVVRIIERGTLYSRACDRPVTCRWARDWFGLGPRPCHARRGQQQSLSGKAVQWSRSVVDFGAILPAGKRAVLSFLQQSELLGEPNSGERQHHDERKGHGIDRHPAAIVVGLDTTLVFS